MFNRRVAILLMMLALTVSALYVSWRSSIGLALPAGSDSVSAQRWQVHLEGNWDKFSSVGQAWTMETEVRSEKPKFSFLNREEHFSLPSRTEFAVAARKFRIPSEWSARTMQLVLGGVDGHVRVYLNGIDNAHKIGEFEGLGGTTRLDVPAGAFQYGTNNILILELSASAEQRSVVFGSSWPAEGEITGELALEAVVETSLSTPKISVSWQGDTAQVSIQTNLIHHSLMERGPWTVSAVMSDGSAGVAQTSSDIQAGENEAQSVTLHLAVSKAHRWSPQDPFLYQLHLTLVNSVGDQDDLAFPIGLRSLSMTGGKVLLNGRPLVIHGKALGPGDESRIRQAGQIASFLKEERRQGVNLIYFVGPVPDPLWLQAADHIGIGVWAEWPLALTPAARLPNPEIFGSLSLRDNNHPSLWAWTVGKGLDPQVPLGGYFAQAERTAAPNLAFLVRENSALPPGVPAERALLIQGGNLQGPWGSIVPEGAMPGVSPAGSKGELVRANGPWPRKGFALGWGVFILFLTWMNLRSASWRYKEIEEKKPKRRLRQAWFWHGLSVLGRTGTLAGILTTAAFRAPTGLGFWFPQLWPCFEVIQEQNPWLIWLVLGFAIVLLRLLQTGLAAPRLPGSPHPYGLALWLEQRYRWLIIPALLWVAVDWGFSWLSSLLAYVGLSFVFLPWRIRDVQRIGGRYRSFLYVPGLLAIVLFIWFFKHTLDWVYLWHLWHSSS